MLFGISISSRGAIGGHSRKILARIKVTMSLKRGEQGVSVELEGPKSEIATLSTRMVD